MSSGPAALLWTERLVALAVVLQTIELLQLRRWFSDDGVWRWSILREEHTSLPAPLRWLFGSLLPYRRFVALLGLRLVFSAALASGHIAVAPLLLLSHLAVGARFRGTFNGGSDYMMSVTLIGLSLAACARSATLVSAALAYICVQLVLSYFIAGLVKLRQPAWRSGEALRTLLGSGRYRSSPGLSRRSSTPFVARAATLVVLVFECAFPLTLLGPHVAVPWLAFGACFHLANARLFGLNRFFFAWISAYPALLHFAAWLRV